MSIDSTRSIADPAIGDVEFWKPIEGWPGYDVSDWGHVRSFWGAGSGSRGRRAITDKAKLIGFKLPSGHRGVLLYRKNSTESRRITIHTLVLEAFVGPKPKGHIACHFDGDPANNRVSNLRWDTYKANQLDNLRHGVGSHLKVSESMVPEIWRQIVGGALSPSIAQELNLPISAIVAIRCGTTWTHITRTLPGWPLLRDIDAEGKLPIYPPSDVVACAGELWEILDEWPAYRVSSLGRFQSRWVQVTGGRRGEWRVGETWRDRVVYPNKDGHFFLWLSNGVDRKMRYLHALVLTAFAGPRPTGYVGCHIDGDKSNNRASNLRWDTVKSNAKDRIKHRPLSA